MIKIFHQTVKDKKIQKLKTYKSGSWVFIEKATRKDLKTLSQDLSIDFNILKNVIDPFEIPRLEIKDENLYIFTRVPQESNGEIITTPLLIVLTPKFIITIAYKKLPFLSDLIKNSNKDTTTHKIKLLLQIFNLIYEQYKTFLTSINKEIKTNRIQVERIKNKDIIQLIQHEETLNEFVTDLVPMGATLNNLLASHHIKLINDDRNTAEDLMLANSEIINLSKAKLRSVITLHNAYSTIMTNNLNQVIRVLTGLTVILMVPTIITGIYGMNIILPFAQNPEAFWIIMALTSITTLILLFAFIKNRWF